MSDWVMVETSVAERYRLQAEKARLRRARYEYTHPSRNRGGSGTPRTPMADKPFIIWDGEGPQDTGYSLLGNSEGMEICYPKLRTEDCLNLIIETEQLYPDAIHIGFGFNYDVSNILWELPWRHFAALHKFGSTIWKDWEIQHIPHKWFKVKHGQVVAKIFDVRSYFSGGLVSVLSEWAIGPWGNEAGYAAERHMVEQFKKRRAEFMFAEIGEIAKYMRLELKYTKLLMEQLRVVFGDAGYLPRSWHGPGALARMALARHHVYDAMAETPIDVRMAAQMAFAGGRFEPCLAGHIKGKVYVADLNSAYPYFATFLPNLNRGTWRRGRNYEPGKFAVYKIRYEGKPDAFGIYPLFRRMGNGNVVWPYRTEGWFWAPEAALVASDKSATFLEALVFDEDDVNDRPFAWLNEYYRRRKILKNAGNPAQWTFKLIINAVYGQLAQRAGWDRKHYSAPKSHQLEWAGFITSGCRARVYAAARKCGDKLVSIDTDGITSLAPIDVDSVGDSFGQWELDEYDDGIFWQSGIYMLKSGTKWIKAKMRGIPKGSYTAEQLLDAMDKNEPLRLNKKVFITYGLALLGQRDKLNTWQTEPHEFTFGGTGKRFHWARTCRRTCHGGIHRLGMPQLLYGPYSDMESKRHYLPWLDGTERELADTKHLIEDMTLFDQNHLDDDEAWVREYAT